MRLLALLLVLLLGGLAAVETPPAVPADGPAPTATPAAGAAPAAAVAPAPGYRLAPGDIIHIVVFDHPDLELQVHVTPSGTVSYPLVGQLDGLVGRTVESLRDELQRRLADGYIRNPLVTILMRGYGPRAAYVLGSVQSPREIALSPHTPTSAMQAIGKAGGFTEVADRSRAQVVRPDPLDPARLTVFPLPADDTAGELAKDVPLENGDLIVVPRVDRVYVLGQVGGPGAVAIPPGGELTAAKAISLAGGFAKYARQSEVQVLRGGRRVATVDVRAVLSGEEGAADTRLEPGDTVYVPESRL